MPIFPPSIVLMVFAAGFGASNIKVNICIVKKKIAHLVKEELITRLFYCAVYISKHNKNAIS